jgi:CDP-diglyceride synthetase
LIRDSKSLTQNLTMVFWFRTTVAIILASVFTIFFYYGYSKILAISSATAITYDYIYTLFSIKRTCKAKNILANIFFLIVYIGNLIFYYSFTIDPYQVFIITTITQVGDVFQYLFGRYGTHKIGWISKNKTYEGYICGLLAVNALFFFEGAVYISSVYLQSCLSGLIFSLVKRLLGIKDFSNLLGPHGGWLDRCDSIFLPILITYISNLNSYMLQVEDRSL